MTVGNKQPTMQSKVPKKLDPKFVSQNTVFHEKPCRSEEGKRSSQVREPLLLLFEYQLISNTWTDQTQSKQPMDANGTKIMQRKIISSDSSIRNNQHLIDRQLNKQNV